MMNAPERLDLDAHITGHYGEDQLRDNDNYLTRTELEMWVTRCEKHIRQHGFPPVYTTGEGRKIIVYLVERCWDQGATIDGLRKALVEARGEIAAAHEKRRKAEQKLNGQGSLL